MRYPTCKCPRANHEHGTYRMYEYHGCRCANCTEEARFYRKITVQRRQQGLSRYTDAEPIRKHIDTLRTYGISYEQMAQKTGICSSTIIRIHKGDSHAPKPKRILKRTAKPILELKPSIDLMPENALIPALASQRKIRALFALGWNFQELGDRSGIFHTTIYLIAKNKKFLSVSNVQKIDRLYEQLWDKEPPAETKAEKINVTRTRNLARKKGWALPLAWDSDQWDDPDAKPRSTRSHSLTEPLELRQRVIGQALDCCRAGEGLAGFADAMSWDAAYAERRLIKYGRADLLDKLG